MEDKKKMKKEKKLSKSMKKAKTVKAAKYKSIRLLTDYGYKPKRPSVGQLNSSVKKMSTRIIRHASKVEDKLERARIFEAMSISPEMWEKLKPQLSAFFFKRFPNMTQRDFLLAPDLHGMFCLTVEKELKNGPKKFRYLAVVTYQDQATIDRIKQSENMREMLVKNNNLRNSNIYALRERNEKSQIISKKSK